jgi:hypothetical protein
MPLDGPDWVIQQISRDPLEADQGRSEDALPELQPQTMTRLVIMRLRVCTRAFVR